MIPAQRILALGAHTDDIELGCGGLLSRFIRKNIQIKTAVFSNSQESLPPDAPHNLLVDEYIKSMSVLGIEKESHCFDYPVRKFSEFRQSILEDLVRINREFRPDLVITMGSSDTHQDHQVIHQESIRAFRNSSIICYELPWNQFQSQAHLFVELSQDDIDIKTELIMQYESQIQLGRPYVSREYIETAAKFRGFQSRLPLAEAYEVITQYWRL